MTDDRFDAELAERLRAYEGRLPAAASPGDASATGQGPRWALIGLGALAVAAAVLVVLVLLGHSPDEVGDATPSPSASASADGGAESRSPSPSGGASQSPTPPAPSTAASPTANLDWTEAGRFGSGGGRTTVTVLVRHGEGLVAVGVAYEGPLPNLGPPPPHAARVWRSADGSSWEDVSPTEIPENTQLTQVLVAADGDLVAFGVRQEDPLAGVIEPVAWESPDGERWAQIDSPFPAEAWVMDAAQGAVGTAAIVVEPVAPGLAVWWTDDGRTWERVHELGPEGSYVIGAGDDGFVVAGHQVTGDGGRNVAWASGDGQAWFAADTPPGLAVGVAPRGPDWAALSNPEETVIGEPSTAQVWSSANGLEWGVMGSLSLEAAMLDEPLCSEWPAMLLSAGPWLVAGTTVSYPCSEGGVQTRGAQSLSVDGTQWTTLPFGGAADEIGGGTSITGAVEVAGQLVLAGERNGEATFWVGSAP